jgi:protein-disulfide isomerase
VNATEATKNVRKEAAREKARAMRDAEKKRKRRNRLFAQGGVVLGLLAIVAVVLLVILNTKPAPPISGGPQNMISDGILLKGVSGGITAVETPGIAKGGKPKATDPSKLSDTVNIVTYIDYFCPVCQAFETANATQINQLVASGVATLEIHPIQILDSSSQGTRYSSRAVNAAACVANYEPDKYVDVTAAFYANQPKEQTTGLTNDQIVQLVQSAGAKSDDVKTCITKESFKDWVAASTNRALSGPLPNTNVPRVTGTPTVIVDGQQYTGGGNWSDPNAFIAFFDSIAQAKKG